MTRRKPDRDDWGERLLAVLCALAMLAVLLAGCSSPRVAFTNGSVIVVRPEFLDTLNRDERGFVWAHELAHILRLHSIGVVAGMDTDVLESDADLWAGKTMVLYGYNPCAGVRLLQRHKQIERAKAMSAAFGC